MSSKLPLSFGMIHEPTTKGCTVHPLDKSPQVIGQQAVPCGSNSTRTVVETPPDRPPIMEIVIQSAPPGCSQWESSTIEQDCVQNLRRRSAAEADMGTSFSIIGKLMPRRPLPSACVNPSPGGEKRKRRASSVSSSSQDESTECSPQQPSTKSPLRPKKDMSQRMMPPPPDVSPTKRYCTSGGVFQSPKVDSEGLKNLSLKSPSPSKVNKARGGVSYSMPTQERKYSIFHCSAPTAYSLHRPSLDLLQSPVSKSPHKSFRDFGKLTPSPRKRRHSSNSHLPPLGRSHNSMICNGDIQVTPRKSDDQPGPYYSAHPPSPSYSSPRKMAGRSRRRASPKFNSNWTPTRSACLLQRFPLADVKTQPGQDDKKTAFAGLEKSINSMICNGDINVTPRKNDRFSPYYSSPRKMPGRARRTASPKINSNWTSTKSPENQEGCLMPRSPLTDVKTQSRHVENAVSAGSWAAPRKNRLEIFIDTSIKESTGQSSRKPVPTRWSDSSDDEEFVLAPPTAVYKEPTVHKPEQIGTRGTKQARR